MSDTKTCNLTELEIKQLVIWHGYNLNDEGKAVNGDLNLDNKIERINYLNKRLKAFKEVELTEVKSTNTAAGWGSNG